MINDDGKLKRKLSNKRVNALKEGLICNLSYDDIVFLLEKSNIKSSDWCLGKYSLARFNDIGDYNIDNCRFILQSDNVKERTLTEKMRDAGKRNIKKVDHKIRIKNLVNSEKFISYNKKRKKEADINKKEKFEKMNPLYRGNKNSQYGTMWITDGIDNKKISKIDNVPDGWKKGRIIKNKPNN